MNENGIFSYKFLALSFLQIHGHIYLKTLLLNNHVQLNNLIFHLMYRKTPCLDSHVLRKMHVLLLYPYVKEFFHQPDGSIHYLMKNMLLLEIY